MPRPSPDRLMVTCFVLTAVCAATGAYAGDLTWVFSSVFGIAVLIMPYRLTKDRSVGFASEILLPLPFVLVSFIVLTLATGGRMGLFEDLWPVSIALQAWALMIYGCAALIVVNNHRGSLISKRWMLLFSMLVANTLMSLYVFYIFAEMIRLGIPVYDDYTVVSDSALHNWYLMAQMTITLFFTIAYGFVLRRRLRSIPKQTLVSYHKEA